VHHSGQKLSVQELDPRNYADKPPCSVNKIIPAGKPMKMSEPVSSLFS
jgi:hypothetical protein